MYPNIPLPVLTCIGAAFLAIYVIVAAFFYRRRLAAILGRGSDRLQMKAPADATDHYFPPLIDRPASHPAENIVPQQTREEYSDLDEMVLIEDQEAGFLLRSAEHVVEQIQDVVDHIASSPANPDEVFTKIRAIVSQYTIFENTEYFDAINNFVAVTVQRDCDLALTPDDLKALWFSQAA